MMGSLFNFLVTNAYAESAGLAPPSASASSFSFVLMFVVLFLFIYFAIWRPQNKRAKEQQNLLNSLAKGDEVVMVGGLLGRISKITEQYIVLSVANNVEMIMQKSSVANVLPKGTLKSIE